MRVRTIAALTVSLIGSGCVACTGDGPPKPPPPLVQPSPVPTPLEHFQLRGLFDPACQPPLPVIVTAGGVVVSPADAEYGRAVATRCYDTVAHALEDDSTRRAVGAPARVAPSAAPVAQLQATAAAGVFARLRTAPFTSGDLPATGVAGAVSVGAALQPAVTGGQGLVGEVDIPVRSAEDEGVIGYLVFATEAAAAAVFAGQSVATPAASNPVRFTPVGFAFPVVCRSEGQVAVSGEHSGVTRCSAQLGYILVVGQSTVPDPGGRVQHGNNAQAIALTAAGVRHFERVTH